MKRNGRSRWSQAAIGALSIAVMAGLIAMAIAQFNRAFDSSSPVTVDAPRAGLLLDPGSSVKMRGVVVGHVDAVRATAEGGADLTLALDPNYMRRIPSNVGVRIVPPTVFGNKYVDLVPPTAPDSPVRSGGTIQADHVTVEVNDTFAHLMSVLSAASPAKVNAALTALSTAVQGRGNELGQFLDDLDRYLALINPSLGTLRADLPKAASVLGTYARATPGLLTIAKNATTTSNTLVHDQASLDAVLMSFTGLATTTSTFLASNGRSLVTTLDVLTPTARLLAKYSPELPCFLGGLAVTDRLLEKALGGRYPGINAFAGLLPADAPYKNPKDLPVVGANNGPNCYGLPSLRPNVAPPHYAFNVGPNPYAAPNDVPGLTGSNLAELLFGSLSGLVTPK